MPSGGGRPMSALGQKQTYASQQVMSALPPIATEKADIRNRSCPLCPQKQTCAGALGNVRYGPIADMPVDAMPQSLKRQIRIRTGTDTPIKCWLGAARPQSPSPEVPVVSCARAAFPGSPSFFASPGTISGSLGLGAQGERVSKDIPGTAMSMRDEYLTRAAEFFARARCDTSQTV